MSVKFEFISFSHNYIFQRTNLIKKIAVTHPHYHYSLEYHTSNDYAIIHV